jgi:hypothetical protein
VAHEDPDHERFAALLRRVVDRDPAARRELLELSATWLWRDRRRTRASEDAVQTTYLELVMLVDRGSFSAESTVASWRRLLSTMFWNNYRDELRRGKPIAQLDEERCDERGWANDPVAFTLLAELLSIPSPRVVVEADADHRIEAWARRSLLEHYDSIVAEIDRQVGKILERRTIDRSHLDRQYRPGAVYLMGRVCGLAETVGIGLFRQARTRRTLEVVVAVLSPRGCGPYAGLAAEAWMEHLLTVTSADLLWAALVRDLGVSVETARDTLSQLIAACSEAPSLPDSERRLLDRLRPEDERHGT